VQISTCWMKAAYIIRQGSCKDSIMNTSFLYTARQCIGSVACFVIGGGHRENHRPATSHWQTLSPWVGFELTTLVIIDTAGCQATFGLKNIG
jgi:hypothetical protein